MCVRSSISCLSGLFATQPDQGNHVIRRISASGVITTIGVFASVGFVRVSEVPNVFAGHICSRHSSFGGVLWRGSPGPQFLAQQPGIYGAVPQRLRRCQPRDLQNRAALAQRHDDDSGRHRDLWPVWRWRPGHQCCHLSSVGRCCCGSLWPWRGVCVVRARCAAQGLPRHAACGAPFIVAFRIAHRPASRHSGCRFAGSGDRQPWVQVRAKCTDGSRIAPLVCRGHPWGSGVGGWQYRRLSESTFEYSASPSQLSVATGGWPRPPD